MAFFDESAQPALIIIVGAGPLLGELIRLVGEYPDFHLAGILDPSPSLRGQFVNDIPILGWLTDIPRHVSHAVIGTPVAPNAFDRSSVYRLLQMRGLNIPILRSTSSVCENNVTLAAGTILMPGSCVKSYASTGINSIIGENSMIESSVTLADHHVVPADTTCDSSKPPLPRTAEEANLELAFIKPGSSIQDAMSRMNSSSLEILLVLDDQSSLVGSITDGDIRRGMLAGLDVGDPVSAIMNPRPVTARLDDSSSDMFRIMRDRSIRHLPVVDSRNRPVALRRLESLLDDMTGQNAVVMAGGMGTRLRPFTENLPKPLVPVGGKPILDHIMTRLRAHGIRNVVLSLNYLGDRIRSHIGDGQQYGTRVNYLTERMRLGTAGALSLLNPRPTQPFLVMNGDLITDMSFSRLLKYQREKNHAMVVCVRQHSIQVPYGVIDVKDGRVESIREKPVHRHFINAGIYALSPDCLEYVPTGKYFDMTDLITTLLEHGKSVGVFPIIEYWRDIGTPADLEAASAEQNVRDMEKTREQKPLETPQEAHA